MLVITSPNRPVSISKSPPKKSKGNKRRNDPVNPVQLCRCYSKALSGFTSGRFVFFLSKFSFIKVAFQLAGLALLAAVADIGWLIQFRALGLLKVRTPFKTLGLKTVAAGFPVCKFTGTAQITVMLAILADNTRVVSAGLLQSDVGTDFFGNGCRILSQFSCDGRKAFLLFETDFNGNSVTEG